MVKIHSTFKGISKTTGKVRTAVTEAVETITDDLVRTSSETAPHDHGILELAHSKEIVKRGTQTVGIVEYHVKEENGQGDFNYAYWIHEDTDYELGENSKKKASSGGGMGMSGTRYPVGNHYLTRPLFGEEEAYKEYIQKQVNKAVK